MKKYILLLILFVFASATVDAQRVVRREMGGAERQYPGRVQHKADLEPELEIINVKNYTRGDSLCLNFEVVIRGLIVASDEALHLIPVYRKGTSELRFPEILVNGKKRDRYYRREQALLSHSEYWDQKPYATLVLTDKRGQHVVSYKVSERIPDDMQGGALTIDHLVEDCCDWHLIAMDPYPINGKAPIVKPSITPLAYEGSVTFIRPEKEVVKERNELLSLYINYIVDRYDVLPNHANNAIELQKVDNILRPLLTQPERYQIKGASIKGYASPEASYEYNLLLSRQRADGFKSYLLSKYGLYNLSQFPAVGMGEDWEGLRRAVAHGNMPNKEAVLGIIDGVGLFNGREKLLMELAGGVPYKYMFRNYYPSLRRMEMLVNYTVRSFDLSEAEEVIYQRPQDLSQEEIYQVARKRSENVDRKDYGREYDVAAKYFPDDAVANINAASAALVRGDLDEAWLYLSKIQGDPRAYNNIGVYHWMKGDLRKAEHYFVQAKEVKGEEERAEYNLKQLRRQSSRMDSSIPK